MDHYLLTNGGTTLNLGSYVRAEPGPAFGEDAIWKAVYAQNARVEGAQLAFEQAGIRMFTFPLLLASGGIALSTLESLLRILARPNAVIDLKPEGVATADMVRFDVLTGRYKPEYQIRHHEQSFRLGTLELDVEPFGYLPTWITLASAASVGLPGTLAIPAASIIGDVHGFLRIAAQPSNPAVTTQPGTWMNDTVAWSVAGRPSFQSYLHGGSWISEVPSGAYAARSEAIAATVMQWMLASNHTGWTQIANYTIPAALEPAYRGRFRAYVYARQALGLTGDFNAMQLVLDAVVLNPSAPMASAQLIATLGPQQPSTFAPQLIDLGEITLPPVGSGAARDLTLRLWGYGATNAGTTNTFGDLHAVALLPLEGPNGVVARGLAYPNIGGASQGTLVVDGDQKTVIIGVPTGPVVSVPPVVDALRWFRGDFPKAGASTVQLNLVGGSRRKYQGLFEQEVRADDPDVLWKLDESGGAATYKDAIGSRHGIPGGSALPSGAQAPLVPDDGKSLALPGNSAAVITLTNTFPWNGAYTIEAWVKRGAPQSGKTQDTILGAGITATYQGWIFRLNGDSPEVLAGRAYTLTAGAFPDRESIHHYVVRHDPTGRVLDIHRDGALIASRGNSSGMASFGGVMHIGGLASVDTGGALHVWGGQLDHVAMYSSILATGRIQAHYEAGMVEQMLARPAPAHAAVSVQLRPRFTFIKGGI